jgi:putative NIF3 family GTP cyclohydrolase 1 type 2
MSNSQIEIYQTDDGLTRIDVRMDDDTVWLTQAKMVDLFQSSKSNISEHIRYVFDEGELVENSVVRDFRTTAADEKYIAKLKERNISVYVLHHPLDNFGKYSTCGTLADRLGLKVEKPAFLYCGATCGVIGTTDCKTIGELHDHYSKTVGHKTSLYQYGNENIGDEKIAVCPGGGNAMFVINEMMSHNIMTLITGVTIVNDYSRETHEFEKANGINVLGGTHYATEKYAPMEMCKYFIELGLPSEFIEDEPDLFDL